MTDQSQTSGLQVSEAERIARERDPMAWIASAFSRSDEYLYRELSARREISLAAARREIEENQR